MVDVRNFFLSDGERVRRELASVAFLPLLEGAAQAEAVPWVNKNQLRSLREPLAAQITQGVSTAMENALRDTAALSASDEFQRLQELSSSVADLLSPSAYAKLHDIAEFNRQAEDVMESITSKPSLAGLDYGSRRFDENMATMTSQLMQSQREREDRVPLAINSVENRLKEVGELLSLQNATNKRMAELQKELLGQQVKGALQADKNFTQSQRAAWKAIKQNRWILLLTFLAVGISGVSLYGSMNQPPSTHNGVEDLSASIDDLRQALSSLTNVKQNSPEVSSGDKVQKSVEGGEQKTDSAVVTDDPKSPPG